MKRMVVKKNIVEQLKKIKHIQSLEDFVKTNLKLAIQFLESSNYTRRRIK